MADLSSLEFRGRIPGTKVPPFNAAILNEILHLMKTVVTEGVKAQDSKMGEHLDGQRIATRVAVGMEFQFPFLSHSHKISVGIPT